VDEGEAKTIEPGRLRALLEAYGGAPERWPDAERCATRRLVDASEPARALWRDACDLDRLLDLLPPEVPSPALSAAVLAAAPRRRPGLRCARRLALAIPLAAAAALVLCLVRAREDARAPSGASAASLDDAARAAIGVYGGPTDALLEVFTTGALDGMPVFGCADPSLACGLVDLPGGGSSRGAAASGALA
jgi:hypothetical protein